MEQDNKTLRLTSLYQLIFGSPEGKEVLEDLEKACHMHMSTFDENPNVVLFREGERSVILRIKTILKRDLSLMQKTIQERTKENAKNME